VREADKFRLHSDATDEARRREKKYRREYKVVRNPDRHDIDRGWVVVVRKADR